MALPTHQPCYRTEIECKNCGEVFLGRKRRKFCSHSCALKSGLRRGYHKPGFEATIEPTDLDIAWAAGIYEGEGSAFQASRTTVVVVAQKGPWILDKLRDLFGGVVYKPNKDGVQQWQICGDRAHQFLGVTWKYLSPRRREQALKALT